MARRHAEMSESTRRQLLLEATTAFARHGYAEAPIEELVRAAGLTRGALYHHFGSKQGLFEAVLRALDADILARVEAARSAGAAGLDDLLGACRTYLRETLRPEVRRILLVDAPAVLGHDASRALDRELGVGPLQRALTELQAAGEVAPGVDVPVLAALLNGMLNEAAFWIAEQPDPLDALERVLVQLAQWLRAVRG